MPIHPLRLIYRQFLSSRLKICWGMAILLMPRKSLSDLMGVTRTSLLRIEREISRSVQDMHVTIVSVSGNHASSDVKLAYADTLQNPSKTLPLLPCTADTHRIALFTIDIVTTKLFLRSVLLAPPCRRVPFCADISDESQFRAHSVCVCVCLCISVCLSVCLSLVVEVMSTCATNQLDPPSLHS